MTQWLIRTVTNQLWYWFIGYRFGDADGYERLRQAVQWYQASRNAKP